MASRIFIYGTAPQYSNYVEALTRCGGRAALSTELTAAEDCDGLLLPGGGDLDPTLYGQRNRGSHPADAVRDAAELTLAHRFLARGRPIFGICRGLQVLNVALGGTLRQDLPNHGQIDGADGRHFVSATKGSVLSHLYGPRFAVNSAHHQAVERLGDGLTIAARTEDGVIEALWHRLLPVYGVQWHPERLRGEESDGDLLFSLFLSHCAAFFP
jgi:putative glutamine amidotransferase